MKKILTAALLVVLLTGMLATTAAAAPNIAGTIAIVMCHDTGDILYERNAYQRHIPASMTKTLTGFIVYEEIERGNLTMDCMVYVSAFASRISSGGYDVQGNHFAMTAGAYHSVRTMLYLIMLPSSNGASVALAEHISGSEAAFVERMNETATRLGMYAGFVNSHGATVNHTTAYSVAILTREFINRFPDMLNITSTERIWFEGRYLNNTNLTRRTDSAFFDPTIDGFKTGVIREAGWGHSLTAYRDGRRIIAVVMNSADNNARHRDATRLLDFGFEELARREAARPIIVQLDGQQLQLTTPARLINGRVMVPVRDIFEAMGATIEWNDRAQAVIAVAENGDTIIMLNNVYTVFVNATTFETDVPPQIIGDRTFVPLRVVSEAMGRTAEWDAGARMVVVS